MSIPPHKWRASLFTKQLSLKRISVLVAGILSVLLAGILPFSLYLSNALTFEGARYFGSFMFYSGIATCLYIGLTTRFRVDWKLRKQAIMFGALMFCVLSVFAAVEAPAVNALTPLPSDNGPNGSKAYKFSVPFTEYQWVVAQFRDGTYYAINGSDWNILTIVEPWQPVAPWAALATNKTALIQQVQSVTTAGKILLNELSYPYALTVAANVTVVESLNGLTREFINSANSQGSPYTISTDTVNSGYYMAQDRAGRFLDEFTSSNCSYVVQSVFDNPTFFELHFEGGTYDFTTPVTVRNRAAVVDDYNSVKITGEGHNTELRATASMSALLTLEQSNSVTIRDLAINSNEYANYGLFVNIDPTVYCGHTLVERCLFHQSLKAEIYNNASSTRIENSNFGDSAEWCIISEQGDGLYIGNRNSFGETNTAGTTGGHIWVKASVGSSTAVIIENNHFEGLTTGTNAYSIKIDGAGNSVGGFISNNYMTTGQSVSPLANTYGIKINSGYWACYSNRIMWYSTGILHVWQSGAGNCRIHDNIITRADIAITETDGNSDYNYIYDNTCKDVTAGIVIYGVNSHAYNNFNGTAGWTP